MILSVNHIHKSFQEVPVLQDVSFHIEAYDKAAIVGINGAGKTTLLRIIMKELAPDEGAVTVSKDTTIGYLSQHQAVSVKIPSTTSSYRSGRILLNWSSVCVPWNYR